MKIKSISYLTQISCWLKPHAFNSQHFGSHQIITMSCSIVNITTLMEISNRAMFTHIAHHQLASTRIMLQHTRTWLTYIWTPKNCITLCCLRPFGESHRRLHKMHQFDEVFGIEFAMSLKMLVLRVLSRCDRTLVFH